MNEKKKFYTELAYLLGIIILAAGTSLMEQSNFGMSMVVAPAYLIYRNISQGASWFTFGMAEYCLQALLLVSLTIVMRKFKTMYIFSFITAIFYGFTLDFCMKVVGYLPCETMPIRILFYLNGMILCAIGVSLLFHTYIAPEAYELIVKEIADCFNKDIHKVKTIYDCVSCVIAVILSFAFFGFGHFEGIKFGTIICAVINGWLISRASLLLNKYFEFKDVFR